MRNYSSLIIIVLAVMAFIGLLLVSANSRSRQLNQRITLKQKDKIPYGTYVARELMSSIFPKTQISYDKKMPGEWDSLDIDASNQAVVLIAKDLNAEDWELKRLYKFVQKGNYAFIITNTFSNETSSFFRTHANRLVFEEHFGVELDSLQLSLEDPPFINRQTYMYPGRKYENYFSETDSLRTIVLGRNEKKRVNFIQLNSGKGSIFIHLAPLAFSNYFILHKDNIHYYEEVFSLLPASLRKIVWNEYYLEKRSFKKEKPPGLFRVLFQYPAFKWGLLTAVFTLLLFVLLEIRRKQRMIPIYSPPRNESLDFIKTIGRLYYDQNDHVNLARKMSAYFLDHLRNKHKIATNTLDESFITTVHAKTGYPLEEINRITKFILFTETAPAISDKQLSLFHELLESFYQNT